VPRLALRIDRRGVGGGQVGPQVEALVGQGAAAFRGQRIRES
jgi:hypothetical protein